MEKAKISDLIKCLIDHLTDHGDRYIVHYNEDEDITTPLSVKDLDDLIIELDRESVQIGYGD